MIRATFAKVALKKGKKVVNIATATITEVVASCLRSTPEASEMAKLRKDVAQVSAAMGALREENLRLKADLER